ncbi:MAG: sugar ABC transporter ATP-binding protein [Ruminococcaceae bacterium]|nr:sugar ABC transporter ATP-binding protein [Oscillospiraceae bacterium]
MGETILTMEGIHKRFPGVHALNNCRFDLRSGEVHALVGENGAGKSTLMKVLTGIHKKDEGKIVFMGEELNPSSPRETQDKGISIIHQELNLMPHLTAAQNIFIGREPKKAGFFTDDDKLNRAANGLFHLLGLNLNPRTPVANITVAMQQMVEIAKALSFDSKVLIMDEPTAALTDREIEELFSIIRSLKTQGVGIVYISHRMEELMQITDRISVMRDGQYIQTVNTADTDTEQIINMMVGRTLFETTKTEKRVTGDEKVLEVRGLATHTLHDVSFTLHRGEILGFAGLMGAGRTEVARAVFGADLMERGSILVNGRAVTIRSPQDAVRCGIGYLSEDRKQFGLALGMSVEENTVLASLDKFNQWGFINFKKTAKEAERYVAMLKTKTPSIAQNVKNLSGGNQQKVIIAKWLLRDCDVLIFDEPTRGIDVGAKSEIYKLLFDLAKEGKSIIMISSELPEILRMSDRVAVMCEGRITRILDISEADQETIMKYATMREEIKGTGVEHIE